MGQAADDLRDMELKQSLPYSEWNPRGYKEKKPDPTWKMRDGTTIKLKDMKESHILNCIAMLERTIVDPWEYGSPDEHTAAYDAFMQGVHTQDERNNSCRHNIKLFKKELERRKSVDNSNHT